MKQFIQCEAFQDFCEFKLFCVEYCSHLFMFDCKTSVCESSLLLSQYGIRKSYLLLQNGLMLQCCVVYRTPCLLKNMLNILICEKSFMEAETQEWSDLESCLHVA